MATSRHDLKLLRSLRQGDFEAFDRVYYAHCRRLHSFLYRLTWDERAAEELTQEVFVTVWKAALALSDEEPLARQLYRIAMNAAAAHLREEPDDEPEEEELDHAEAQATLRSLASIADARRRRRTLAKRGRDAAQCEVRDAVMRLGIVQRSLFALAIYQGMPAGEIAPLMGMDVARVRELTADAERKVRSCLSCWVEAS